jgi:hypothetical protein
MCGLNCPSWNRLQLLKDSHDPLPSDPYEFAVKERIVEWCQKFLDLIEQRNLPRIGMIRSIV